MSQQISRELEDYRSPSLAARAVRQLKEVGKMVKPGQRVRFLFTLGKPGVYAWDLPEQPDPATVDVACYRELLLRAAREILQPFDWHEDSYVARTLPSLESKYLLLDSHKEAIDS